MKYRVFNTESEAMAAEAAISKSMGYSRPGVNAATGAVVPSVLTVRWDVPRQIADGRWVIVSPDDNTGIEAAPDWWPTQNMET